MKLEEILEPINYYGKQHTVKLCYCQWLLKALSVSPQYTTQGHWIKMKPRQTEAQGPLPTFKVPFARMGPAVLKLPSDNHQKTLDNYYVKICCQKFFLILTQKLEIEQLCFIQHFCNFSVKTWITQRLQNNLATKGHQCTVFLYLYNADMR